MKTETEVTKVLAERGARYGKFLDHATICQDLKLCIERNLGLYKDGPLPPDMKQALDVICDKIARLTNGDHNYVDNWVDIAGYAQLIVDRLEGKGIYAKKEGIHFEGNRIVPPPSEQDKSFDGYASSRFPL